MALIFKVCTEIIINTALHDLSRIHWLIFLHASGWSGDDCMWCFFWQVFSIRRVDAICWQGIKFLKDTEKQLERLRITITNNNKTTKSNTNISNGNQQLHFTVSVLYRIHFTWAQLFLYWCVYRALNVHIYCKERLWFQFLSHAHTQWHVLVSQTSRK